MTIPDEAVEAAAAYVHEQFHGSPLSVYKDGYQRDYKDTIRHALELAAPFMLAGVIALADSWEADGEEIMALSKRIPGEREATMCLMEGATMVENARLVRNAIGAAK